MKKDDVACSAWGAGFRRLELATPPANTGEYRCPACDEVLETFDGSAFIAYRMTIQPSIKAARPNGLVSATTPSQHGELFSVL